LHFRIYGRLAERSLEIRLKPAEALHLRRFGGLIKAFADEEILRSAMDQKSHSLFREQSRAADIAELFTAALHECDKPVTLKKKILLHLLGGNHLNSGRLQALQLAGLHELHFVSAKILVVEALEPLLEFFGLAFLGRDGGTLRTLEHGIIHVDGAIQTKRQCKGIAGT
jgi:hypothetical protein